MSGDGWRQHQRHLLFPCGFCIAFSLRMISPSPLQASGFPTSLLPNFGAYKKLGHTHTLVSIYRLKCWVALPYKVSDKLSPVLLTTDTLPIHFSTILHRYIICSNRLSSIFCACSDADVTALAGSGLPIQQVMSAAVAANVLKSFIRFLCVVRLSPREHYLRSSWEPPLPTEGFIQRGSSPQKD